MGHSSIRRLWCMADAAGEGAGERVREPDFAIPEPIEHNKGLCTGDADCACPCAECVRMRAEETAYRQAGS